MRWEFLNLDYSVNAYTNNNTIETKYESTVILSLDCRKQV